VEFWKVSRAPFGIVIACAGHDKNGTVATAVDVFEQLLSEDEGRFTIFADLTEMSGYESQSRLAWQEAFRRHRERVDQLVLIGAQSSLIRMGAAAVGSFAGIPVSFVDSWHDVAGATSKQRDAD
jgi:hypothetical protein